MRLKISNNKKRFIVAEMKKEIVLIALFIAMISSEILKYYCPLYINFNHDVKNIFSLLTRLLLVIFYLIMLKRSLKRSERVLPFLYSGLVVLFTVNFMFGLYYSDRKTYQNDLFPKKSQVFVPNDFGKETPENAVFYKIGCTYCQEAIPVMLNEMKKQGIAPSEIVFVDADTNKGKQLAKKLGIEHAAIASRLTGKGAVTYSLASKDKEGKIIANSENIKIFIEKLERSKK
ncbi:hypothetical protein FACS1894192_08130 [Bacilli bacterium]|nr:hypothetical protein FACS1894192_08130 [Bacilli bacterium]